METVVFGKRVVEALGATEQLAAPASEEVSELSVQAGARESKRELQGMMWGCAGIERNAAGLSHGLRQLAEGAESGLPEPRSRESWECAQMHVVARLMLEAALRRTESRGAHYRSDFPERDDGRWQRRQVFRRAD